MQRPLSVITCVLVPAAILFSGIAFGVAYGYKAFRHLGREDGRGSAPPGFGVEILEPGRRTLWLHTYTVFDGRAYESGERLPQGAKAVVTDEATGETIVLNPYFSARKSLGNDIAVSLGTFEVENPTRLTVSVGGVRNPVVLSVAPVKLGEIFGTIIKLTGIGAITLFLAAAALIVMLKRRRDAIEAAKHEGGGTFGGGGSGASAFRGDGDDF